MTQRNYKQYAQSPAGKAARARAHARYVQKRREQRQEALPVNPKPLATALSNWSKK